MSDRIIGELEWDSRSNNDSVELLYGDKEDLERKIIGSSIVSSSATTITLDNGLKLTFRGLASDGNAKAEAEIEEITKDLRITSINLGEKIQENQTITRITTFYSNNRVVAKIKFTADKGRNGVYSSVSGFTINTIGYAVLFA